VIAVFFNATRHDAERRAVMSVSNDSIIITRRDRDRLRQVVDLFAGLHGGILVDFLQQEITRANVVESEAICRSVATMNSRLRYHDPEIGAELTATLVYPSDEDAWLGRRSVLEPTGTALLGLSEGQTITWRDFGGRTRALTLHKVLYQPEAVGRFDL
jgi:regulator of nucleoside diphosphate kinase